MIFLLTMALQGADAAFSGVVLIKMYNVLRYVLQRCAPRIIMVRVAPVLDRAKQSACCNSKQKRLFFLNVGSRSRTEDLTSATRSAPRQCGERGKREGTEKIEGPSILGKYRTNELVFLYRSNNVTVYSYLRTHVIILTV